MNINDRSTASRQFEAHPPFWGSKVASKTTPAWQSNFGKSYAIMVAGVLAFSVVLGGLYVGMQSLGAEWMQYFDGRAFQYILIALLFAGVYGWYWWSRRRKIIVFVTSDDLSVSTRPGDVYSFNDAKLGTWGVTGGATMGTALHLQSGQNRFILGGRDRRVASGTRLEAPDAGYGLPVDIDAWVSAADFDEILTMVGRRSGLDVRPPEQGQPTRCLLYPNALMVQETGMFAVRKKREILEAAGQPRLAIDVGPDTIRIIDAKTNALIASTSPVHVSATPVTYRPTQHHWFPSVGNAISNVATNYWSTAPGMRVSVPGMAPLAIGCRDTVSGLDQRFSWPDDVPSENARADYEVSGTDWLTLVEKFGLAPYLIKRG